MKTGLKHAPTNFSGGRKSRLVGGLFKISGGCFNSWGGAFRIRESPHELIWDAFGRKNKRRFNGGRLYLISGGPSLN